jgi:endoglucanase
MATLNDLNDNVIYQMHEYLDSDGSETSSTCVSSTIGQGRIMAGTNWCRSNKKNCIIGEVAAGSNSVCKSAFQGM